VEKRTIQETLFMKTAAQIIGGAQALPAVSFDLKECFEEYLPDGYKTFLNILRVVEKYPHIAPVGQIRAAYLTRTRSMPETERQPEGGSFGSFAYA
jgi:hypothetical protein